ncbi:MAG: SAM-dependent methyltransferase, partial [Devosiaceae bacterium]|nr:SAM-dependent methyltransferase [Devosiaceae bacterium]
GALIQIRKLMQPYGLFLANLPGPDTLIELRNCLSDAESEISGGLSPRVDPFVTVQVAGSLLQRAGFALPVVDSQRVTVNYDSMFDLIRDLRAMGATNALKMREKSRFRRKLFERAAEIYSEKHSASNGRISATFEIISLSGWAPHSSQQKPLKPGSATVSLADLLK